MGRMPKAPFQPCIPTRGTKVPHHADWIHEIKQDGFRLIIQRDMDRVRLFIRNGYDWTSRYPLVVEAARTGPIYGGLFWSGAANLPDA